MMLPTWSAGEATETPVPDEAAPPLDFVLPSDLEPLRSVEIAVVAAAAWLSAAMTSQDTCDVHAALKLVHTASTPQQPLMYHSAL